MAKDYGRAPREVRDEWPWSDFCDALQFGRASREAAEAVAEHQRALNGR